MYAKKLDSYVESSRLSVVLNTTVDTNVNSTILARGWALKEQKSRTVFSKKQINYMKEKVDVGTKTGRKVDPYVAAEDQRSFKFGDIFVFFSRNEYLTGHQISSFFSRLATKDRKMDENDYSVAKVEDVKSKLTVKILSDLPK